MIIVVGTTHVLPLDYEIKEMLSRLEGWHVAIELDQERLEAMLWSPQSRNKSSFRPSIVWKILYEVERLITKSTNSNIGVDMISAYKYAKEFKMEISLIDMPTRAIISRLTSIPLVEKLKMILELIFMLVIPKRRLIHPRDFLDVENIQELRNMFEKKYPVLYKVLVEDRDYYLTNRILELEEKYGNVIAFVGALHALNIKNILEKNGRNISEIKKHNNTIVYEVR